MTPITVYLAAPLFTQAERLWNEHLATSIENIEPGIAMFLPQRDAEAHMSDGSIDLSQIYQRCIEGVDNADVVIAVLDGADADSGTCFECGYAFAIGKKIIGLRTDFRSGEVQGMNLMLHHSLHTLIELPANQLYPSPIEQLAERIVAALANIRRSAPSIHSYNVAPKKSLPL